MDQAVGGDENSWWGDTGAGEELTDGAEIRILTSRLEVERWMLEVRL
jgi:hypothetical protein